ncbi:hypothetical protein CISG_08364 [Coccidioides immitis RMSCC 3703]|uniref:Uncharacterized protein n=1 Tax=Coccidioides immitis RMSCC 3703 TaxID=454286 RepID=A0A0J8R910_COCIT|nr:hypothetical protein CISG_08364 [Coccidioides immitis RMSCC 3703]
MPGVHGHNSTAAAVYAAREAQSISHSKPPVVLLSGIPKEKIITKKSNDVAARL